MSLPRVRISKRDGQGVHVGLGALPQRILHQRIALVRIGAAADRQLIMLAGNVAVAVCSLEPPRFSVRRQLLPGGQQLVIAFGQVEVGGRGMKARAKMLCCIGKADLDMADLDMADFDMADL